MTDKDYFQRRATDELAAAERAASLEAKRVHHDLAIRYLLTIEGRLSMLDSPASASEGRLSA